MRLARDESGIALPLAVIMIVLIGVMGAGLLAFVNSDLKAVVEVNQGQKAFNVADAGVQAAKRQLRSDAVPGHYDANADANVQWAYVSPTAAGVPGRVLSLAEGSATVTIQYLLPATTSAQLSGANYAPELVPSGQTNYYGGKSYFKVISTGTTGEAKRRIEAIFYTSKLDVPTAYYTPNDIKIQGNIDIKGVSFFAKGNINLVGNSISIERCNTATPTAGCPALYRDWDTTQAANFSPTSKLNTSPRTDASGNRKVGAGLGAEGVICKTGANSTCTDTASESIADGINDYDKYTGSKGSKQTFARKADLNSDNPAGIITYPFNPDVRFDLDFLLEEAKKQNNYKPTRQNITDTNYPPTSDNQTVFFVEGEGNTTDIDFDVRRTPKAEGTIVVRNGNLTIDSSSSGFRGIIIVTGDGTDTGKYENGGSGLVEGFAIASGDMEVRGSVSGFVVTEDFTTRPGFYGINLWSWRELYK